MTTEEPSRSLEAERAVLGAILVAPDVLPIVARILTPEDFYLPDHRRIYRAMLGPSKDPAGIDVLKVADKLSSDGGDEIKKSYLASLLDAVPDNCNIEPYARTVKDGAVQRRQGGATSDAAPLEPDRLELDPAALYGLAGDVAKAIDPHTEAHHAAVLAQFLVFFGNVVGPTPHARVGADDHFANLFVIIVGKTAKGRKGSSVGYVRRIFENIDPTWSRDRISHGLSSGEGLIQEVRDLTKAEIEDGESPKDRRFLAIETEFGGTLRTMGRDGNILSKTIRQAWDTGNLRTMTKNSPLRSTGAHVSIAGHATEVELLKYVDSTETASGFANRFLWICAHRSKLLPEGGALSEAAIGSLSNRVAAAVEHAHTVYELKRDQDAAALWREKYPDLSAERPGLLGAVTNRAEAQVLRLSLIYALLDSSNVIRPQHLEAALALWRYSFESVGQVFGTKVGDPVADRVLEELKATEDGLSRSEITHEVFDRNLSAAALERALSLLKAAGLADSVRNQTGKRGRPEERWRATIR